MPTAETTEEKEENETITPLFTWIPVNGTGPTSKNTRGRAAALKGTWIYHNHNINPVQPKFSVWHRPP